jgi:NAD(P)-dependent dehydrogenase (short-subunit alcohol dehydrogenase family)
MVGDDRDPLSRSNFIGRPAKTAQYREMPRVRQMSRENLVDDSTLEFSRVFDFSGKVAVVTGAASGIGKAIAEMFSERGARLALIDRSPHIQSVASALGGGARSWEADITEDAQVARAVGEIAATFGRIDVLINNAGVGGIWPAEATRSEDWDRVVSINLTGQYFVAREVAKHMLEAGRGRIVMMASQAALIGLDGHAAYAASKAGLLGMLRSMAVEWGPRGVTVNAISPTVVDTEMTALYWGGEKGERARAEVPVGRFVKPREIAYAAMFLSSEAAAMINGANLVVDGGNTIR